MKSATSGHPGLYINRVNVINPNIQKLLIFAAFVSYIASTLSLKWRILKVACLCILVWYLYRYSNNSACFKTIKLDIPLSYEDILCVIVERLVKTEPLELLYRFPTSDLLARVSIIKWNTKWNIASLLGKITIDFILTLDQCSQHYTCCLCISYPNNKGDDKCILPYSNSPYHVGVIFHKWWTSDAVWVILGKCALDSISNTLLW